MSSDEKTGFHWELIKLLMQVAWADDGVEPVEREIVLGLAKRLSLPARQVEEIERCLDGRQSLPPPDMRVLRGCKEEAIQVAEQLVIVNDDITDEENRLLVELNAMLGAAVPPPTGPGSKPGGDQSGE